MFFYSYKFIIFLIVSFSIYWNTPNKFRWIILLIGSYIFYMSWNVKYMLLILLITFISYISAILIDKTHKRNNKRTILVFTTSIFIGILLFFKYFGFACDGLFTILDIFNLKIPLQKISIILPIGISFYSFQTLGYVIDVYRGDLKAEKHIGKYAAFVSFFPQLLAGPIARAKSLIPQISNEHNLKYDNCTYGFKLIAWGAFKKLVIADTIVVYTNNIYDNIFSYQGLSLIVATVFFAIQIYCDFSGYSDIAIGLAKLFDIELMINFKSPYLSSSLKEFWSRWHISLSTWFRDYVYIPLGGNRKGKKRQRINLIITFLLSGIWHGANSNFLIWGGIHGSMQVAENLVQTKNYNKERPFIKILKVIMVFAIICCAWVFFRADNLSNALYIFKNMFVGVENPVSYIIRGKNDLTITEGGVIQIILSIFILFVYDFLSLKKDMIISISSLSAKKRWLIYVAFVLMLILWIPNKSVSEFIYFQF